MFCLIKMDFWVFRVASTSRELCLVLMGFFGDCKVHITLWTLLVVLILILETCYTDIGQIYLFESSIVVLVFFIKKKNSSL